MKHKYFSLIILILTLSLQSLADNWEHIGITKSGVTLYVKPSSIKHGKETSTACFKKVYNQVRTKGGIRDTDVMLLEFDSKGRMKIKGGSFVLNGKTVRELGIDDLKYAKWIRPPDDSFGNLFVRYITEDYRRHISEQKTSQSNP